MGSSPESLTQICYSLPIRSPPSFLAMPYSAIRQGCPYWQTRAPNRRYRGQMDPWAEGSVVYHCSTKDHSSLELQLSLTCCQEIMSGISHV